jgi:hypothetical protein
MSKTKSQSEPRLLDPCQFYRWSEGWKYFGYKSTQLDQKIKDGEIPAPIPLSDSGRASGWTGQMIIDHQRELLIKADARRAKADARRAKADAERAAKSKHKPVAA